MGLERSPGTWRRSSIRGDPDAWGSFDLSRCGERSAKEPLSTGSVSARRRSRKWRNEVGPVVFLRGLVMTGSASVGGTGVWVVVLCGVALGWSGGHGGAVG